MLDTLHSRGLADLQDLSLLVASSFSSPCSWLSLVYPGETLAKETLQEGRGRLFIEPSSKTSRYPKVVLWNHPAGQLLGVTGRSGDFPHRTVR